jgi:hypothetical protein
MSLALCLPLSATELLEVETETSKGFDTGEALAPVYSQALLTRYRRRGTGPHAHHISAPNGPTHTRMDSDHV